MIRKLIYNVGLQIRSPKIIDKYKFLKISEKWSEEELEKYQLEQLKRIVNLAYNKSSFYKNIFQNAGIKPEDIQTLQDIKKIPIISKSDLINNSNEIQNNQDYKKLFFSETSGSTGEPLVFYRNSEWDAGHRAAQLRGYSWYDVKPWDLNGYFWGYSLNSKRKFKTKILDSFLNRFRLFSYKNEEIKEFAIKLKRATYLEGYSSMIYEVAKLINESGIGPFNLKMVKGTSEKIYDSYQEEVRLAFGKKMVSEYGSSETGIIAFECNEGNMHITMENVIVEEENGEAVITNLISDSFPILRYKLGDSIILDNDTVCQCGMKHKIIKDVIGRVGKVIYGNSERYPSLTLYYIFKNLTLKYNITISYQAVQKEKGKLEFHLDRKISEDVKYKLQEECRSYFSDDISILVNPVALKRDYTKKFRDFISEID